MSVRHVIIGLNFVAVVAIVVYLVWAVLSPKRADDETTPANLTPFLADEDLESRRLERVQGWALLFAAVVAVALPALLAARAEPAERVEQLLRQERGRARRGPVLELVDARRTTRRSRCSARTATAPKGQGGSRVHAASTAQTVNWQVPPLNTVLAALRGRPGLLRPAATSNPTARSATSPTSSPTAGRVRRCRRGVSPAAARRTTSRSRTSSRTCARSSSSPAHQGAGDDEPRGWRARPTRRPRARST